MSSIAVGICGHAPGVHDRLAATLPRADILTVPDVCDRPERIREIVDESGAKRLVLGLCGRPAAPHEFQSWARRAGLDPFALALVDLGGRERTAVPLLAAAAARMGAFTGSRPEQLRLELLSWEGKRSRKSLFVLPPTTYRPVAAVDRGTCKGELRCGLCVRVCPRGAITLDGGAEIDEVKCTGCGVCVTSCPSGAIGLPDSSLSQYEAEIGALLKSGGGAPLAFTCRSAWKTTALSDHWLPVEVPCAEMVTPGWLLQALAAGAQAVGLFGCGEACRCGSGDLVAQRVDYTRSLLALLRDDASETRVHSVPDAIPPLRQNGRAAAEPAVAVREPAATVGALLDLTDDGAPPSRVLVHRASPLGVVELKEEACTACGACAAVCPTGALTIEEEGSSAAIVYEPAACSGCGRCAQACPEAAARSLSVRAETAPRLVANGPVVLKRAPMAACRRCGGPIAPDAMLERIEELLGGEGSSALVEALSQLCVDCRGLD